MCTVIINLEEAAPRHLSAEERNDQFRCLAIWRLRDSHTRRGSRTAASAATTPTPTTSSQTPPRCSPSSAMAPEILVAISHNSADSSFTAEDLRSWRITRNG